MSSYRCASCGNTSAKWVGRCPACGSWSSVAEASGRTAGLEISTLGAQGGQPERLATGLDEVDRVLGGGLVPGGVVLLAGEPGIGKSTLVLQVLDSLSRAESPVLLVTGEESLGQVGLRAARLGVARERVLGAATTSIGSIAHAVASSRPAVLVIDSIQTLVDDALEQPPGSPAQVRATAGRLIEIAKSSGTVVILVGHVTKEGTVAGPKVLEHMVDAVITLEGERNGTLRLLHVLKNRFGSCDETAVFEMGERGLEAVADPSALLLADRRPGVVGSVVFPSLEGSRAVLVEVQALVGDDAVQPRRVALGVDPKRLALLLGVLSQHASLSFGRNDVFVASSGGLPVKEPSSDLAVSVALMSAHAKVPLDPGAVALGEVGLGGEVRRVPGIERRLAEAARLGFARALVPAGIDLPRSPLRPVPIRDLADVQRALLPAAA